MKGNRFPEALVRASSQRPFRNTAYPARPEPPIKSDVMAGESSRRVGGHGILRAAMGVFKEHVSSLWFKLGCSTQ